MPRPVCIPAFSTITASAAPFDSAHLRHRVFALCAEEAHHYRHGDGADSRRRNAPHRLGAGRKAFRLFQAGELKLYDVPAKSEKTLLSLTPLQKVAVPIPEPLRFDWQNRRVSEDSIEWSHSGKQLLLSVRGDLFFYTLDNGTWEQLTATPEAERDPKLSPDGLRVAFRRGHDLYSIEIATRQLTRLTEDGSATLLNGELDWVYPEELDLARPIGGRPTRKTSPTCSLIFRMSLSIRRFHSPVCAVWPSRSAIRKPEPRMRTYA